MSLKEFFSIIEHYFNYFLKFQFNWLGTNSRRNRAFDQIILDLLLKDIKKKTKKKSTPINVENQERNRIGYGIEPII